MHQSDPADAHQADGGDRARLLPSGLGLDASAAISERSSSGSVFHVSPPPPAMLRAAIVGDQCRKLQSLPVPRMCQLRDTLPSQLAHAAAPPVDPQRESVGSCARGPPRDTALNADVSPPSATSPTLWMEASDAPELMDERRHCFAAIAAAASKHSSGATDAAAATAAGVVQVECPSEGLQGGPDDAARSAGDAGAGAALALDGGECTECGPGVEGKSAAVETRRLRLEEVGAGGGSGLGITKRSRDRGGPEAPAGRNGCVGERAVDEPEAPEDGGWTRWVRAFRA